MSAEKYIEIVIGYRREIIAFRHFNDVYLFEILKSIRFIARKSDSFKPQIFLVYILEGKRDCVQMFESVVSTRIFSVSFIMYAAV